MTRVLVRRPVPADARPYADAVRRSVEHIAPWNPVDPDDFERMMAAQRSGAVVTWFVVDRESEGLAGKVNVNGIVRGRLSSAALGYDAYLPWAGTGRMSEGLRLVVARCFAPVSDSGLGLHRLEVNVQPGNERSLALARRVGFRLEGFSPRFLFINDAWRDHHRFALTVEEWTAP